MMVVKNISRILGAIGIIMLVGVTGASDAGILSIPELAIGLLISVLLVLVSAAHCEIYTFCITLNKLYRSKDISVKNFTRIFRQVGYFTTQSL